MLYEVITPQVSTKYSRREGNYARIADAVARIAALRRGNYFVFLPSFDFLERVSALFKAPVGFAVLRQERSMKAAAVEAVVAALRGGEAPTVITSYSIHYTKLYECGRRSSPAPSRGSTASC